ncbi:MAG: DUF4097 domain-containing protein [Clostridiales bacterium]|nr:DUF4097 domain-containing protein [Clostridiales bacterium]
MGKRSRMANAVIILLIIMVASFLIASVMVAGQGGFRDGLSFNKALMGSFSGTVDQEKSEAVAGVKNIKVSTTSEDISLIASDSNEVKAHLYGDYASANKDLKLELVMEKKGDSLEIKVRQLPENLLSLEFNDNVKLDVYVPKAYTGSLDLNGVSSEVAVASGFSPGELSISTVSGDFKLEDIKSGKVSVKTTSGSGTISGEVSSFSFSSVSGDLDAGNFKSETTSLSTTSGSMSLSGDPGNVEKASSVSGDLDLEYSGEAGSVSRSTTSGGTRIALPAAAAFTVEFTSTSGDVKCDFPITVTGTRKDNQLSGVVNGGNNKIKVSSVSGDLEILKK